MDTLGDRDLVRLAVSGETWAFGRLVERYGERVLARVRRVVRRPDDAEDLAQEVFLLAFRRLASTPRWQQVFSVAFENRGKHGPKLAPAADGANPIRGAIVEGVVRAPRR